MSKLFLFIKKYFLTVKFLTFGIIGVMNTAIHLSIYWVAFNPFDFGAFWSNTVAFIGASVFSYFANAIFTFKPKNKNTTQFSIVMLVFLLRLLMSNGLTSFFNYGMIYWIHADYAMNSWLTLVAPFLASALLIPIAYFALDFVFKKTDIKKS